MKTKSGIPWYLYPLWALGGIIWFFVIPTIYIFDPETELSDLPYLVTFMSLCSISLVIGAIVGILFGRIGYAIKPNPGASIARDTLVIVGVPVLVVTLMFGYFLLQRAYYEAFIQQVVQQQAAIPALKGSFQELSPKGMDCNFAVSEDGKPLAEAESMIRVWDLEKNPNFLSPDGRLLLSKDLYGRIILRDAKSEQQVADLGDFGRHEVGKACWIAFSPDGRLLAASRSDHQVFLWDTLTFQPVGELAQPKAPWGGNRFWINHLAFSPDGKRLAVAVSNFQFGKVALWDVEKQSLIGVTQPVNQWVRHVNFSPDGRRLLITSEHWGSTLYIWDSANLEALGLLDVPKNDWLEAKFLPDGRLLVCYRDWEVRMRIWTIESP